MPVYLSLFYLRLDFHAQNRYVDTSIVQVCRFSFLNALRLCYYHFLSSRNAYRAEISSFLSPIPGESSANTRIRERIEFNSNLLFLIEDLYLTVGPGYMLNQSSTKINVRSPLYWVRNQLASQIKELMIAKKMGWQVLKSLKNQVFLLYY